MHVHVRHLSQDSTFDLFPNPGCGLSVSAAYTPVFTVNYRRWYLNYQNVH